MHLQLLTCAKMSSVDASTNNISLFSLLEQFSSSTFPFVIPELSIVMVAWKEEGDEAKVPITLRILLEDKELSHAEFNFEFSELANKSRIFINVGSLVIPEPGQIVMHLSRDGVRLGEWRMEVKAVGKATVKVSEAGQSTS